VRRRDRAFEISSRYILIYQNYAAGIPPKYITLHKRELIKTIKLKYGES
jgi:hypothetical protein